MLVVRIVYICLLIIGCTFADYNNYKQKWLEFKQMYGKHYDSLEEETRRFTIFVDNQKKIFKHNRLYSLGDTTYTLKSNEFADLTHQEFLTKYINKSNSHDKSWSDAPDDSVHKLQTLSLPPLVDWRQNGSVTDVQSQGPCRSSYAFATTGALEAQYQRQTGNLLKFSEQYLLDCSRSSYNNSGCDGGSVNASLRFVSDKQGINTEQSYPYRGVDETCQLSAERANFSIKSVNRIASGQEWFLQTAIATVGPVAVSFDASLETFQFYSSGIYYDFTCSKVNGNHFGLAVGYGTENKLGYYIVKNSFGKSWGEDGYVRMARFRNNNCGIATNAIYPVL